MVKVAAMGDNVVDCYVDNGTMYPGGNTLNVSVFIRRFGGASAYVGAIGDDAAGHHIMAMLRSEGVDTSRLKILDGPTAYCVIGHEGSDRVFITFDLGVSMFTPDNDDFRFIDDFDAVHIGLTSGLDSHLERIARLTRLSYDFATEPGLSVIERVAPLCFLASASGGDLDEGAARELQARLIEAGAEWALVTLGKRGAVLANGEQAYAAEATPVAAVDTLGAGDTFIARTLYGLLQSEHPDTILAKAAEAAAETCRHFGAVGHGVPTEISADLSALLPECT